MAVLARLIFVAAAFCMTAGSAAAQIHYQPTPAPIVTADNEPWYLAGEPVMYAGNIYYPAGPQVHFNGNEMVRSGFFHAIPLYTLTTIEPYSKVFVPIGGGLMQPYERRRTREIAGTVGSTVPSFPVVRSSEPEAMTGTTGQAAASPSIVDFHRQAPPPPAYVPHQSEQAGAEPGYARGSGYVAPLKRPLANHGLFVEYNGRRWFVAGSPEPLDRTRMKRIGEYHGFPVYANPRDPAAIYVPVTRDADDFVARYASRRPVR
jgi:hypothetical protein